MLPSQEHRASYICRGLITPWKERAAHPEPRGPAGSGFRLAGGGQVGVTYRGGGASVSSVPTLWGSIKTQPRQRVF